ncbi:uncharacterized protein LOC117123574 [Anneissia japonica]|uniref:uncharacterized protein LOC117123574 n=1 Tax=Anneissia japonica TaxID=1529436 RepID=UPI0014259141|nr:uncharacterized protein LOC117123574 [Anneissia japonica]
MGSEGYKQAKAILSQQFGQPHIILHSLMRELLDRKVRPNDSEGLWKLIGSMKKCNITLTQMGYMADLNSTENLLKVQGLLPVYIQTKWAKTAQNILVNGREPLFLDMINFLEEKAAITSNMFGRNIHRSETQKDTKTTRFTSSSHREIEGKRRQMSQSHFTYRQNHSTKSMCPLCINSDNHRIWSCSLFKRMSVNERWNTAKKEGLCFKFLGRHLAKNCDKTGTCKIDGCKRNHYRLLHDQEGQTDVVRTSTEGEQLQNQIQTEETANRTTHPLHGPSTTK